MDRFAEFGKASVLVGLQYAVETLQGILDEIRAELNGQLAKPKRGRPPGKATKTAKDGWGGWSADPEERSREMARRMAKGRGAEKLRISDPRHPGHEAWIKKLRDGQRRIWGKLTPAQRSAKIRKQMASRKPRVRVMAVAS